MWYLLAGLDEPRKIKKSNKMKENKTQQTFVVHIKKMFYERARKLELNGVFDDGDGFIKHCFQSLTRRGKKELFNDFYNSLGWYKYKMIESIYVRN